MHPSDRALLIRNIGSAFDGLASRRDVDIILRVFGLGTVDRDQWGNGPDATDLLIEADDQTLLGIASHLGVAITNGVTRSSDAGSWGGGGFRVFISHLTAKKVVAKNIAHELALYGIKAFVAHEDIQPSKEWAVEIMRALQTCHAMIALLSPGFISSNWCDQEVGVALGRQVPIVPLKYESDPHGFLSAIQAIAVAGRNIPAVMPQIVRTFLSSPTTEREMGDCIVSAVATAGTSEAVEKPLSMLPNVKSASASAALLLDEASTSSLVLSSKKAARATIDEALKRFGYKRKPPAAPLGALSEDDIPF